MRITHLSHTDGGAGAGRAAYRIHRSLLALGQDSRMLVGSKRTSDPSVIEAVSSAPARFRARLCEYAEAKISRYISAPDASLFSPAICGYSNPLAHVEVRKAEVIALYWVNGGFISPERLGGLKQPIVWRLSDTWPFTGGCHYTQGCERFSQQCGDCPQSAQPSGNDASRRLFLRKRDAWRDLNLTIAAPSHWIADLARHSTLFADRRIEVIPTGIDTDAYAPRDRAAARVAWNIPPDKTVLLFGAMDRTDRRKGFAELHDALQLLKETHGDDLHAVLFGDDAPPAPLPISCQSLGRLQDDVALATAYASADLVVVPSREDNLPNVALEAIACGVPVIGFNVCGMGDIVQTGYNGALANEISGASLAHAIREVLSTRQTITLAQNARTHALGRFSLTGQAQAYLQLYRELVSR